MTKMYAVGPVVLWALLAVNLLLLALGVVVLLDSQNPVMILLSCLSLLLAIYAGIGLIHTSTRARPGGRPRS